MKKIRLLALILAVVLCLSSCSFSINEILGQLGIVSTTTTTEPTTTTTTKPTTSTTTTTVKNPEDVFVTEDHSMSKTEMLAKYTLTQEEVDAALTLLDNMVEISKTATSVDEIDAVYDEFETAFYHIAQQMTIANIVYYCNMSDETATQRHLDTTDMFYSVQDKYMQSCRTMYLESPFKDELFADWTEEEIQEMLDYDPAVVALKSEIEELQAEYNDLSNEEFEDRSAEIYAQIVMKNQQLAKLHGYDNYYDYASENVYSRDYTRTDLEKFRTYVKQQIVPVFETLNKNFQAYKKLSSYNQNIFIDFLTGGFDTMKKNYVLEYFASLDGTMGEAMNSVFGGKNCVFSYNSNSHPTAFCTYLYEDEKPICFFGSNGQTSSTIVHEVGHYYASYVNNDLNNFDLCETHSQGNELLFLKFTQKSLNKDIYSCVKAYNLFNMYYIIVMATMMDEFEQRVYDLESVEGYTSEDFDAIMDEVIESYGKGASWFTENLTDPYNYWRSTVIDNPVYYISYAVSAVAAIEIFAVADEDYEAAQAAYIILVEDVTPEDGFIGALEKAGLGSPFEASTFTKVAEIMKKK